MHKRRTRAPVAARPLPPQARRTLKTPAPERILLASGTFMMGSTDLEVASALSACRAEPFRRRHVGIGSGRAAKICDDDDFTQELVAHEVFLSAYWIDRTEVTVARYRRCVAAGACAAPPYASGGHAAPSSTSSPSCS